MAGGSSSSSNLDGSSAGGGRQRAVPPHGGRRQETTGGSNARHQEEERWSSEVEDEDEAYRSRLPTSTRPWLDAQARQAAEAGQPVGGSAGPRSGRQPAAQEAGEEEEAEDERRSSPIVEISLLLAECVQHGLRTIAFCKSRWVLGVFALATRVKPVASCSNAC